MIDRVVRMQPLSELWDDSRSEAPNRLDSASIDCPTVLVTVTKAHREVEIMAKWS